MNQHDRGDKKWDRTADLQRVSVPTLIIGARYDTMDPKHMEWMAEQVQRSRYLYCPQGSHLAIYDDQRTYMDGLVRFLKDMDARMFEVRREPIDAEGAKNSLDLKATAF